jgi:branched-chain amino acid transport system substrate-binding protein
MKFRTLAAAVLAAAATQFALAQDAFKIGAVYSLTGPIAPYGVPQQKGLQLKVDELNARGGLKGRKVEILFYDSEGNGNRAVQLVRKAVETDKVDIIIGPSSTGESLAVSPIANSLKVPMITHSGALSVVEPATPYVFQTAQYDRVFMPVVLKEFQRLGYKKVALLSSTDGYGQSGSALIKEMAPRFGITIVEEQFDRQDTDMTAQVLRAKASNADVMFIYSTFPAPAVILRNAKATGYDKPIYNSAAMAAVDFIKQAGATAENTYVVSAAMMLPKALPAGHPSQQVVNKDYEAYLAKYKEAPNPSAQHAMDAVDILEAAVKTIDGPITRQALRDAIEKVDIYGANGLFKFSPTAHGVSVDNPPIVFLKIVNGAFTAP